MAGYLDFKENLAVALGRDEITIRLLVSSFLIMLGLLLSTIEVKSTSKAS